MSSSKSKQKQRSSSPTVDIEYHAASKKKPAQEVVEEDEEDNSMDALIFKIRQASSKLFQQNSRPANNAEIADMIGEEESKIKSVRDSLKLARQGKRLNELRTSAIKVGFSRRIGASHAELKGLDIEQSLITPADVQRLARCFPLQSGGGSYSPDELKMRGELIEETLPIGSAREIIAAIEPVYRDLVTEAVSLTARKGTQRITPSTMKQVLSKYQGLTVFTSCTPPDGIVRHAKSSNRKNGIEVIDRRTGDKRKLLCLSKKDQNLSDDQKRNEKASNKIINEVLKEMEEKKKKSKSEGSGSKFVSTEAEETEEVDDDAEQPKKKKSKSKSK